jgi:hypothetical protein
MRGMRRAGAVGLTIMLTVGLAVGATHAAKPKKVKTEAEVEGVRFFPGGLSEFFGDVHSKKNRCEKGREVRLVFVGPKPIGDPLIGTAKTDGTGDWVVDTSGFAIQQGPYVAEVERKRVGSGQKKLTCKGTTSPEKMIDEV